MAFGETTEETSACIPVYIEGYYCKVHLLFDKQRCMSATLTHTHVQIFTEKKTQTQDQLNSKWGIIMQRQKHNMK